ncbi:hypothetical protein EDB92DRAFT_1902297 [Lactarius akahatsu]|uniref:LysM domain-containing protein n=1 Tax=Lactarius akahatsu TaxID=416441 RepID=A0AAD4L4I2_9AGAM|nr:hypothetical protein EDB92DRAFT_1902297 [Lactarius akahatsu]
MYAISTAAFVSVLVLASSLAVIVQATGPRTLCTETYNVPEGATCDNLGAILGANQSAILTMNPGISCEGTLPAGEVLCTKTWDPTCTLNATATDTTCDGLASKWNITQADFINYNDNVNGDCTDLVSGQPYCVSISGCYPGNPDPVCQQ